MNQYEMTSVEKFKTSFLWRFLSWVNPVCWIFLISLFWIVPSYSMDSKGVEESASVLQTIHGKVLDEEGKPLEGASVTLKGTQVGTQTDSKGEFSFPAIEPGSVLVISYTGYLRKEVEIKDETRLEITLDVDPESIDEVVVVGFGKQKKTDMVGAVTSVKPSDLRVPSSNLTTSLAGRVAGMIAFQRSGEPGEDNANFFVRGVSSFGTGKKDPLILIDGMELSTTELARLRPDDIESFSVLQDATATAVYGSRAANGVILIETKEGKEGRMSISLRAEGSLSMPTTNLEFADPVSYMRYYNDARKSRDPFAQQMYSNEKIDGTIDRKFPLMYPTVDWMDMLFKRQTFNHRYNLDVSGGGKVARYYVAGSYAQDNGLLKVPSLNNFNNNVDLKSYTLRANVNIDLTKSTELVVRLNGNFDDYNGPLQSGAAVYDRVVHSSPVDFVPYYPLDEDHNHVQHIMFGGLADRSFTNPYAEMVRGYKDYSRSLMLAQLEVNQDFSFLAEGLSFKAMLNTNRVSRFQTTRSYNPFYYDFEYKDDKTGEYRIFNFNENSGREFLDFTAGDTGREQVSTFYLQSSLNYDRMFGRHKLNAMLVQIMQSESNARASSLQLSLPHRNLGLSGRGSYSFDDRYYFEFNFGYNGSERFDKSHRFGFFPSVGVAWTPSNEKFWTPFKDVVNDLKFRATYGLVGNDQIGDPNDRFFYLSEVNMSSSDRGSSFGYQPELSQNRLNGINVNRYSNPLITWEIAKMTNLGLDVTLFRDLELTANFYQQNRSNILMDREDIPSTMGLTAKVQANVGEAVNRGMDLSMNYNHAFFNGMWLQLYGNFTYAHSEYKVFEEPLYDKEWWKSKVGYSLNQKWGYIAERLFVDDEDVANSPLQDFGTPNIGGDIKYKDVNGDGKITKLDQVPIGYPTIPEIIAGFGFSYGWKSFDISSFFQASAYSSFFIDAESVQPFVGNNQMLKAFADDHYSLANKDIYALWPRLSTENHKNNIERSTWWMYDGSFLRLKQLEVGYSFSTKTLERLRLNKVRFYLNGSNLFNFTQFKLWDVEMGGDGLGYPIQKVYNAGIEITF